MSTRKRQVTRICVLAGVLLGLAGMAALTLGLRADPGRKAPAGRPKAEAPAAGKGAREADVAAIRAQAERFRKAFESGDAERVASCWTAEGELIGDDGTVYRGRAALEKVYRDLFGAKAKRQAEIERDSLRFPSQDTAIDEGRFKVRVDDGEPTSSRYSALYVREGGQWLMAVVREWPAEGVSLSDLAWLIGTWAAKRDDVEIHTTYEWLWDKSFIRVQFRIRQKDRTLSGFQIIGMDPASKGLRAWTFESEGGFGEATWTRDGKAWILDSAGRLTDGGTLAATILLTPTGPDSFTWQATKRSIDGEEVDDLPPVKVTRVKPKR